MSRTKTVGRQEINAEKKRSQLLEIWRRLKKNKVAVVAWSYSVCCSAWRFLLM